MNGEEMPGKVGLGKLFLFMLPVAGAVVVAALVLPYSVVKILFLGIVALPVAVYVLDKPGLLFFALIFILFSNLDVFLPFRFYRLVLFVFLNAFAVAVIRGRRIFVHDKPFFFMMSAFAIVAVQSLIGAGNLDAGFLELGRFLKILLIVAITTQFVTDRRSFRTLIYVAATGIALSSFLPFVLSPPERYATASMVWNMGVFRYEGFVFEPNMLALVQVFFIPLLFFVFYLFRKRLLLRILTVLAVVGSVMVLIMSFSRSGFVSLVFLFVLFLVVERRNKAVLLTGIILVAAGLVMAPPVYWERIGSIFTVTSNVQEDLAIVSRMEAIKVSFILWLSHPILGVGIGNFVKNATFFMPYEIVVHNSFLQIMAELGSLGILLFLSLLLYNVRLLISMMRSEDMETSQLGRILFVLFLAVLFDGLFLPIGYELILWFAVLLPSLAYRVYPVGSTGRKKSLLL